MLDTVLYNRPAFPLGRELGLWDSILLLLFLPCLVVLSCLFSTHMRFGFETTIRFPALPALQEAQEQAVANEVHRLHLISLELPQLVPSIRSLAGFGLSFML